MDSFFPRLVANDQLVSQTRGKGSASQPDMWQRIRLSAKHVAQDQLVGQTRGKGSAGQPDTWIDIDQLLSKTRGYLISICFATHVAFSIGAETIIEEKCAGEGGGK